MLTPRQLQVYRFVRSYILKYGFSPTEKEVAEAIGIKSRGVAHRYINALVKAGYLSRIQSRRRNLNLVRSEDLLDNMLPVLGLITAGEPQEITGSAQRLDLSELLFQPDHFVYRVTDDSLMRNKINAGDYIICQRAAANETGDIVIAIVNGSLALRRVDLCDANTIALKNCADNSANAYPRHLVHVLGKYKGLIRLESAMIATVPV